MSTLQLKLVIETVGRFAALSLFGMLRVTRRKAVGLGGATPSEGDDGQLEASPASVTHQVPDAKIENAVVDPPWTDGISSVVGCDDSGGSVEDMDSVWWEVALALQSQKLPALPREWDVEGDVSKAVGAKRRPTSNRRKERLRPQGLVVNGQGQVWCCRCRKRFYDSEVAANRAANKEARSGRDRRVYFNHICDSWHLTSQMTRKRQ